jgi:hypothetical protein
LEIEKFEMDVSLFSLDEILEDKIENEEKIDESILNNTSIIEQKIVPEKNSKLTRKPSVYKFLSNEEKIFLNEKGKAEAKMKYFVDKLKNIVNKLKISNPVIEEKQIKIKKSENKNVKFFKADLNYQEYDNLEIKIPKPNNNVKIVSKDENTYNTNDQINQKLYNCDFLVLEEEKLKSKDNFNLYSSNNFDFLYNTSDKLPIMNFDSENNNNRKYSDFTLDAGSGSKSFKSKSKTNSSDNEEGLTLNINEIIDKFKFEENKINNDVVNSYKSLQSQSNKSLKSSKFKPEYTNKIIPLTYDSVSEVFDDSSKNNISNSCKIKKIGSGSSSEIVVNSVSDD